MARVACTHVAKGWSSGVLYSRVARNHSGLGESMRKVGICMMWFYIYRVDRDPHLGLIDSNRRCFSNMKTQSTDLHHSLINGTWWLWKRNEEMDMSFVV